MTSGKPSNYRTDTTLHSNLGGHAQCVFNRLEVDVGEKARIGENSQATHVLFRNDARAQPRNSIGYRYPALRKKGVNERWNKDETPSSPLTRR